MTLIRKITDSDFLGGAPKYMETVTRYAARGILVDELMNVAMMYMSKNNLYKLPGGGLDDGENSHDAFLREVKEETGYEAEIIFNLGYIEEHKNSNDFMQYSYCFIAKAIKNTNKVMLTNNELELGMTVEWMTIAKALEVMTSAEMTCHDYSTKFMILRDKIIIEQAVNILRHSSIVTLHTN